MSKFAKVHLIYAIFAVIWLGTFVMNVKVHGGHLRQLAIELSDMAPEATARIRSGIKTNLQCGEHIRCDEDGYWRSQRQNFLEFAMLPFVLWPWVLFGSLRLLEGAFSVPVARARRITKDPVGFFVDHSVMLLLSLAAFLAFIVLVVAMAGVGHLFVWWLTIDWPDQFPVAGSWGHP